MMGVAQWRLLLSSIDLMKKRIQEPEQARNYEREGGAPQPFFENQKKCSDFEKKTLIVPILGLNFPFKM